MAGAVRVVSLEIAAKPSNVIRATLGRPLTVLHDGCNTLYGNRTYRHLRSSQATTAYAEAA